MSVMQQKKLLEFPPKPHGKYKIKIFLFTSPGFSVAATAKRFENVGPGHNITTDIPVAIFSVRKDSKYP